MWLTPWISVLACPRDQGTLSPTKDGTHLTCSGCQASYPIDDQIIRFIPSDAQAISGSTEKLNEMNARDHFAEKYDEHFSPLVNSIEIPPYLKAIRKHPTDTYIELGAGTGRVTLRYIDEISALVILDFSFASLKRLKNLLNAEQLKKCLFVQADMSALPFHDETFGTALSFQVIEHLPNDQCRIDSIKETRRVLRPGGEFICSAYHYSKAKQKKGITEEGFHDQDGIPIYFKHFTEDGFVRLFEAAGIPISHRQGLVMHFKGTRILGRLAIPLNRILEKTRFGLRYAHLLFTVGRKPL